MQVVQKQLVLCEGCLWCFLRRSFHHVVYTWLLIPRTTKRSASGSLLTTPYSEGSSTLLSRAHGHTLISAQRSASAGSISSKICQSLIRVSLLPRRPCRSATCNPALLLSHTRRASHVQQFQGERFRPGLSDKAESMPYFRTNLASIWTSLLYVPAKNTVLLITDFIFHLRDQDKTQRQTTLRSTCRALRVATYCRLGSPVDW